MKYSAKHTTLIIVITSISIFGLIGGFSEIDGVTNNGGIKNTAFEYPQKIHQNNFDINISPHVISVDTGAIIIPAVSASEFQDAQWYITQPGAPVYNSWTITAKSYPDDHTLIEWWKDIVDGKETRKNITLNYRSSIQDSPIRTINCIDAIPVSYTPGDYLYSSQDIVEKIVVQCNRITIQ